MTDLRNINRQQAQVQYTVATMPTQQETSSSTHTQQRQLIPVNFVQLESRRRNNIGPAEEFDDKPGYERYYFFHEGEGHYLDLSFELVEQLGLNRGQNCEHTIYVSNEVLNRDPEEGGITIDNPEDIILVRPGTVLEREVQTDLNDQENERINALQEENIQIRERLARERNNLQGRLNETDAIINNLNHRVNNLTNDLQQEQANHQQTQRRLTRVQTDLQTERNEHQRTRDDLLVAQTTIDNAKNILDIDGDLEQLSTVIPQGQNLQALINFYNDNRNLPRDWRQQIDNADETIQQLRQAEGRLNEARVRLNLNQISELDNLPQLPQGETINNLLARPLQQQLQTEQEKRRKLEEELAIYKKCNFLG